MILLINSNINNNSGHLSGGISKHKKWLGPHFPTLTL